jgi:type IV secretion system protein TrbL
MGTGVGEAMLIGAAVGGGTSALTGGDPIKGAMIGAAGGGIGAGLGAAGSAFSATTPTVTGAATGATTGAATGAAAAGGGTGAVTAGFEPGIANLIGESYAVPGVVGGTPHNGGCNPVSFTTANFYAWRWNRIFSNGFRRCGFCPSW